jgi:hypothetical protein
LAERRYEELDVVLHSGGGSAHSAYQIVELLRFHAGRLNACVPFWAKSAATLLCLGADKIVVGDHAELGPLDVQIYEEKQAGKYEVTSALNPFKTLEQLQASSVQALQSAMTFIIDRYEMSYDEALRHAVAFVEATTGPLVGRLDPEKLGQYSRELSVATEYGQRLLRRYSSWGEGEANRLVEHLVYGYPSHEYIIDYQELMDLGFEVELFQSEAERSAVKELLPVADSQRTLVRVVEPSEEAPSEDAAEEVGDALADLAVGTNEDAHEEVVR